MPQVLLGTQPVDEHGLEGGEKQRHIMMHTATQSSDSNMVYFCAWGGSVNFETYFFRFHSILCVKSVATSKIVMYMSSF